MNNNKNGSLKTIILLAFDKIKSYIGLERFLTKLNCLRLRYNKLADVAVIFRFVGFSGFWSF